MKIACFSLLLLCTDVASAAAPAFTRAPFINPRIIAELASQPSDAADEDYIVAINLTPSQVSNRYVIDQKVPPATQREGRFWQTVDDGTPPRVCANTGREHTCYRYLGQNSDGLIALEIQSNSDDGTMVSSAVLLVELRCDQSLNGRPRQLLFRRGEFSLGDRISVKQLKLATDRLTLRVEDGKLNPSIDDTQPLTFVFKGQIAHPDEQCLIGR